MIDLSPEVQEIVQGIFKTGRYGSEAEIIREAVSLLRRRDRLRTDIEHGIDQLDRGERIGDKEVFDHLEKKAASFTDTDR